MADQENLDIYLRAKNETDAAFKKVNENVAGVQGKAKGLTIGLRDLTAGFADISGAMNVAGMVANRIGQVYDTIATKTVEYASKVEDTSRMIGASEEEASKLIQASRRIGIEYDTLTTALQTAISKGFRPSIEELGALSDRYLAINDPIARTQFAIATFGRRAGPELQELLEKGSDGLRELYAEVEKTGNIMDAQGVAAAERYQQTLERSRQAFDNLATSIGQKVLPVATTYMTVATELGKGQETLAQQTGIHADKVSLVNFLYTVGLVRLREYKQEAEDLIKTEQQLASAAGPDFGRSVSHHYKYASDLQPGTARGNLYTGEVYSTGGRAGGGPMWAGVGRWVGENGPEWLQPNSSGWVSDGPPAGGGGVTIGNVTIQIQSSEPKAVRREVEQALRDLQAVGRL